jgi:CheY-like chemotaxis protein
MTPEVLDRAIDPFYTTKPLGQGTGLGLSMIYGFARQSGGQVKIRSQVGEGTTVCIYLPQHERPHEPERNDHQGEMPDSKARETVLVIDDEPAIRMLAVEVLSDLGYWTIEAADGLSRLKLLEDNPDTKLLVTDVGLPAGMNGRQVADAARDRNPLVKVLFITDYAESVVWDDIRLDEGMQVLTKPFTLESLARKAAELLA